MNYLAAGYNALRGPAGEQQQGPETVEKLCDRLLHANLLDDRRAAVLGLKGMSRDWKLDVGTKGMVPLVKTLERDYHDPEITVAVLETINTLCSAATGDGEPQPDIDLGVQFTEIFVKSPANVHSLLAILEDTDFYVRFNTVQLLGTLLRNKSDQLQDCVLTAPIGMTRLIDLLDDSREAIRNEGLLLLISLTQSNADIQKIVAFENAFERLLSIIAEQGGADGDIIVQDCLQLIHNLLRYNVSNQNFFRETNCIQRVRDILPSTDESWPEQKVHNTVHVLQLIRVLVVPGNTNTVTNQNVMNQCGIIPKIIRFALSATCPQVVKCEALYAIADVMRGNLQNQEQFARASVVTSSGSSSLNNAQDMRRQPAVVQSPSAGIRPQIPEPAFLTVVSVAVGDPRDEITTRGAATYAFECYVVQNPDAQIALTSTLNAPPEDNPNTEHQGHPWSVGSILLAAILPADTTSKDPYHVWFAATMFAHMIWDNQQCKDLALAISFGDVSSGEEPISLLDTLGHKVQVLFRSGGDARVIIALMCLLSVWLYDHEPSVTSFLGEGSNLQLLIEIITKSSNVDPLVQGVAAFLLGVVLEFNQDPQSPLPEAQLRQLILTRVGADQFSSRISRLRDSRQLQQTAPFCQVGPERDSHGLPDLWFDYAFVEFFKKHADIMQRSIIAKPKQPKSQVGGEEHQGFADTVIQQYKSVIVGQDKEITALKATVKELEKKLSERHEQHDLDALVKKQHAEIRELRASLDITNARYAELQQEQEDLLVCLAEQDEVTQSLKSQLRELGRDVPDDEEDREPTVEEAAEEGTEKVVADGVPGSTPLVREQDEGAADDDEVPLDRQFRRMVHVADRKDVSPSRLQAKTAPEDVDYEVPMEVSGKGS